MPEQWILAAAALLALSGVPGLLLARRRAAGQRIAAAVAGTGAALGLLGAALAVADGPGPGLALAWQVPGGELRVAADGLSVAFLLPIFVMAGLGSLYGLGYWPQAEHPQNGRKLRFFYGLLASALVLVVTARNAVLFLAAWEVMALSAFFLVATEDRKPEVCEASLVYLVATHFGTLCLFALFALLRHATGSFTLAAVPAGTLGAGTATAVFLLTLVGFGLKAGLMPLHVWLPGAHANAPSHVSALLSGVVIKMGVYGIIRMLGLLPAPPAWWGATLLALGAVSGVLGVAFAIGQHDLKRLLAYHSVENIGIIFLGVGLAAVGRSVGRPEWVVLGLAGGLLHVWNHGLFKSLLFLCAGSVLHACHTREIDHLGGLAKRMPWTSLAFLVGAIAICGLPPLNGFVSELLIYLGLFGTVTSGGGATWAGGAFAAPALALIGALAVACFVKVYGIAFLGQPRSAHASGAVEAPLTMLLPMAVLALCCASIGLAPRLVAPLLDRAVLSWVPAAAPWPTVASLAPLGAVSALGVALVALVGVGALAVALWIRRGPVRLAGTWDCGYTAPSTSMQYTSSSFAQMLVELFSWVLRPKVRLPASPGLFGPSGSFASEVPDVVLDHAVLPFLSRADRALARLRWIQQGRIQLYVLYILAALVALLLWL